MTDDQMSPEEHEAAAAAEALARKLNEASNRVHEYAAGVFTALKWRVRTSTEWTAGGELRLCAAPTTIQGYEAAVVFSKERLLEDDQTKITEEIDALPGGMTDFVFGSPGCALICIAGADSSRR